MAAHRSLSEGMGLFVKRSMEVMIKEYDRNPGVVTMRYSVYKAIAEMAYMLSCCHEEGKSLVCKIAFLGAKRDTIGESGAFLEFREPFEFRIDILAKMAASAGARNSYIIVSGDRAEDLQIIGLYTFNNDLERIRHRELITGNMGDLLFNIRIKEPGVIFSCLGPYEMLEFKNNATYKEKPLDEIVGSSIFKAKLFEDSSTILEYAEDKLGEDLPLTRTSCYETTIALILEKMLMLKHGGMLVIGEDDFEDSQDMAIKYRFNDNDMLFDKVKEWQYQFLRAEKGLTNSSAEYFRRIKDICSFIAYLTTVDGAVIMKKNLQIVGYGAELKSGVAKSTISYYNIDTCTMGNFENKGTRHRSGCRYCYQDTDAVVFIISQDGAISGLTYYDGLYGDKTKKRVPTNKVLLTNGRQMLR